MRRGNQEDALAAAADADTLATEEDASQSARSERAGRGDRDEEHFGDDDEQEEPRVDASVWLEEDILEILGDDEQQQRQQENDLPTALEGLLDLELDVHNLPALEDNQFILHEQCDAFGDNDALSLELLALQSPRGKCQQWDENEPSDGALGRCEKRSAALAPEELSPQYEKHHLQQSLTTSSHRVPDLTSPSQHAAPFQPSPRHSADGDEYDLASPVGLPDTPNASQSTVSRWDPGSDLRYEVDDASFESTPPPPPPIRTPSRSVAKKGQRHSFARTPRISPTRRTTVHTPARPLLPSTAVASHQPHNQPQPASVPKRKVNHGGIYSLLLKHSGSGDHEPVLVDEKRSPEAPEGSDY